LIIRVARNDENEADLRKLIETACVRGDSTFVKRAGYVFLNFAQRLKAKKKQEVTRAAASIGDNAPLAIGKQ
jgi:hypothetical protein